MFLKTIKHICHLLLDTISFSKPQWIPEELLDAPTNELRNLILSHSGDIIIINGKKYKVKCP